MSAPSPPPDNSLQVEQMKEAQQTQMQQAQDAKDAANAAQLAQLRSGSRTAAGGTVDQYFQDQGVDPTAYEGSIATQLNDTLAGISPTDPNPGSAFTGAGQTIFDRLQTAGQNKATNAVNQLFSPNFEMSRVTNQLAQPYEQSTEATQYGNADAIIKNMLDRGVLTTSGYNAAKSDLDRQVAGVNAQLNTIGTGLVAGEQSDLRGIGNKARQTAGGLQLGQAFDPGTYSTEADTSFNDFIKNLGTNISAQAPGNLFNTAGLAAIGGAGQGAGNTAYNPQAAAGAVNTDQQQNQIDTSKGSTPNPNSIF
jgi:hypothetical protein